MRSARCPDKDITQRSEALKKIEDQAKMAVIKEEKFKIKEVGWMEEGVSQFRAVVVRNGKERLLKDFIGKPIFELFFSLSN